MALFRVRTAISGATGGPQLATHYFDTSVGTAQDAADAVHGLWQDLRTYISNTFTMTIEPLVYTVDVASGLATGLTGVSGASSTGSDGSDAMSPFTQGLISWHTGVFLSGRELIGRTFIPAPCESQSVAGAPSTNYQSNVLAAGVNMLSAVSNLVVYSRAHHTQSPVTSYGTPSQWSVLKSRR
jgi:hypothetical protein